jgi:hypothetical protein
VLGLVHRLCGSLQQLGDDFIWAENNVTPFLGVL